MNYRIIKVKMADGSYLYVPQERHWWTFGFRTDMLQEYDGVVGFGFKTLEEAEKYLPDKDTGKYEVVKRY